MHIAAMAIGAMALHAVVVADAHALIVLPHRCRFWLLLLTMGFLPIVLLLLSVIAIS